MASWVLFGILAAFGAAGVALFARVGLAGADFTLATALRSVVMTALLLGIAGANAGWRGLWGGATGFDGRAWTFVLLAGICGAASWLAYFAALRHGPAGPVAALDRLSLPLVFVLGVLFLGEKPGWLGWVGLLMAVSGIVLIAADALERPG
jgi:transporter family protein